LGDCGLRKGNVSRGVVAPVCNPSYSGSRGSGGSWFKDSLGKQYSIPYLEKNPSHKKRLVE
jgi:hypothetical protein